MDLVDLDRCDANSVLFPLGFTRARALDPA
jgi:hypothetical protein